MLRRMNAFSESRVIKRSASSVLREETFLMTLSSRSTKPKVASKAIIPIFALMSLLVAEIKQQIPKMLSLLKVFLLMISDKVLLAIATCSLQ